MTSPSGAVIRDISKSSIGVSPACICASIRRWCKATGRSRRCAAVQYFGRTGWAQVVIVARGGGSLEDSGRSTRKLWREPLRPADARHFRRRARDRFHDRRLRCRLACAYSVGGRRTGHLYAPGTARTNGCIEHKMLQVVRYSLRCRAGVSISRAWSDDVHSASLHRAASAACRRNGISRSRSHSRRDRRAAPQARSASTRLRRQDLRLRFAETHRRIEAAAGTLQHRCGCAHALSGKLDPLVAHLTQLSPLKILDRGYAIVTNEKGEIVKSAGQAPVDSNIAIRLAQGRLEAEVTARESSEP